MKDNKFLAPIAIIVGVVAIAAAIIVLTTRQNDTTDTASTPTPASSMSSANQNSSQQASGTNSPTTKPAADTVVPDGTTPDAFVKKYYDLIIAKDFKSAYDYQPASKKTNDVAGFQSTIEGYGIQSAEVSKTSESGEIATVDAKLTTKAFGSFTTTWTFAKKNGKWVADSTQTNFMSK